MVLGTPVGPPEFVRFRVAAVSVKHDRLVTDCGNVQHAVCVGATAQQCCNPAQLHVEVVHRIECGICGEHRDATMRPTLSQSGTLMQHELGCRRRTGPVGHIFFPHNCRIPHFLRQQCVKSQFAWDSLHLLETLVVSDPEDQQIGVPNHGCSKQQQIQCILTSWRVKSDHV